MDHDDGNGKRGGRIFNFPRGGQYSVNLGGGNFTI